MEREIGREGQREKEGLAMQACYTWFRTDV